MPEQAARNRWVATHGRLRSAGTVEKVALVGLLWVIYARILPGTTATSVQLFLGTAAFVVANAAITLGAARSGRGADSAMIAFGVRVLLNVGLVTLAGWLLSSGAGRHLDPAGALFFVMLLSLITLLADRYRPVYEMRFATPAALRGGAP